LIAALQIDSLNRSISVNNVRKAVNSLPSGLNALYESTWGRIKAQTEEEVLLATSALVWLTYAYQSLTIEELQHALAVSDDLERFDEDDIAMEELIVSVCCGLVVVDARSRIIRLVREYSYVYYEDCCNYLIVCN
jgi:hypothetical protein